MTKELELEKTALDDAPKPQLVESKPAAHNAPKRRISRWLAALVVLGMAAGTTKFWLDSREFETTDDAQVDGHFDSISSRISGTVKRSSITPGQTWIRAKPRPFPPKSRASPARMPRWPHRAASFISSNIK